jgi:hypothetical protein
MQQTSINSSFRFNPMLDLAILIYISVYLKFPNNHNTIIIPKKIC